MVKNKTGGKNAKRGARKNINVSSAPRKLRMVQEEGELYGIITKMLGNGQAMVLCHDNKERLCLIRYKFSGRNKSSNLMSVGSWVIVGLRSWETKVRDKLEKCDLLEIYSHQEKTKLVQESTCNVAVLLKHEHSSHGNDMDNNEESDIVFSTTSEVGLDVSINCVEEGNHLEYEEEEIDLDEI